MVSKNRARRGRGEGTIFQRPDGRWTGAISLGYGGNGRRRRKWVSGATKKAVADRLAALTLTGTSPIGDPDKLTLEKYLALWLTTARGSVSAATAESYARNLEKHVNSIIGGARLAALSALHIDQVLGAMSEKSPRLRRYVLAILSRALDQACRKRLIPANPCDHVERPKVGTFEFRSLDETQTLAFLAAVAGRRLEALYILAALTGARQGELLALQWPDVDLKARMLSIRRTLSYANHKTSVKEPKTKKGRRRIELADAAVAALNAHRKRMLAEGHAASPFIFCDQAGRPVDRFVLGREFKRILKAASLPAIRFHDLRHTHASLLLAAGMHPKLVQERLGHSTIGITLDTYSHILPSMQADARDRIERLLG